MDVLRATDFWTSEAWSWFGLVISFPFFFLSFGWCKGDVPLRMTHLRQLLIGLVQSRSHDVKARLQRWKHLVEETLVRFRPIGCGDGVQRVRPQEVILSDRQEALPHGRGNVVFLRAACPRPIRDGLMRRQSRPSGPPADGDREAA